MNFRKKVLAGMSLSLLATGYSGVSVAQASGFTLEEVVVTARKRAENLQEVPIAVTALGEDTIERAGIERADDYISLIPNVTLVDTANVGDTQVSIRGIVSTRDAESTFAYVVDGVLSTNPNSFNEELFDVQQIEVLKGPQGALYGRNAVAGAILVTTKKPSNEFEAKLTGGVANNNATKVSGTVSGPIVEDSVYGRFSFSNRETDGFYKNTFTGQDDAVDFLKDQSYRGRVIWDISDTTSLDIRAGFSKAEGGAINFNAAFAIPQFVAVFGSPTFAVDVNDQPFNFVFNVPGENEQETMDLAIKLDMDAGFADMTASFSYNDLEEYLLSDGTAATFYGYEVTPACLADRASLNSFTSDFFGPAFQPFGVLPPSGSGAGYDPFADGANFAGVYGPYTPLSCDGYQYQERNQTDMSIDVRFTSKEDSDVRWIAGFYVAEIEREVVVAYGADTGAGFLRQPYVPANGPNPTDLLFWDDFDTSVASVYGQVEFDINDTMELAFALRYDYESRDVNNKVPNVPGSGLNVNLLDGNFQALPINAALVSNPNGIPGRSESFSQLQPKVTWSWQASDEINVYASYGVGFRSGGFNSVGTEDTLNFWFNAGYGGPGEAVGAGISVPDAYDKEVSTNIELGAKGEFMDRRLRVNAALFRTNVDDNQFFEFFAGPFGLLRSVTTIDELYIEGFEADVNFVVNEEISLFGGIGLMSSEIEANRHRPLSVGNDVPQAPEKTATLGAQYVKQLGEGLELSVRADWQYTGAMWFHTLQGEESPTIWNAFFGPGFNSDFLDPATGSNAQRDAYDTLNLRISVSGEQWSVTAWGKNITDELYLQEVIPAPEFGGTFNHPSAQAAYGVDFSYRF
jgi:iron complex outermembrane receptor protein